MKPQKQKLIIFGFLLVALAGCQAGGFTHYTISQ